jgi:hypothetical protein
VMLSAASVAMAQDKGGRAALTECPRI